MSVPTYQHKRGDTFSLGGTVTGLPSGVVTVRSQLRDARFNTQIGADLVVTLGAYVDAVTPQTLLVEARVAGVYADTRTWPVGLLACDIEFTEPGAVVISTQTFNVNVSADITI